MRGGLIDTLDWSRSPLGDPTGWPSALRMVVALLRDSKFPMFVAWGPQLRLLYNDAYAIILGGKHPAALGAPFAAVWQEAWSELSPLVDAAMAGEASYHVDLPLLVNRGGDVEQAAFTFSLSPLRDDAGAVLGMFCVVAETTPQVRARRRQVFRLALEERLRSLSDPRTLMAAAAEVLGRELGCARAGYGEALATGRHLMVEADWSDGRLPSLVGLQNMAVLGSQLVGELDSGRTLAVTDIRADARIGSAAPAFEAIGVRSTLAVPLVKDGRFVALLYVHDPDCRVWDEDEAHLTREVAERTWSVLERARAESQLRELNDTLERRFAATLAERKLLADIVEGTDIFVQVADQDFNFLAINRASAEEFARIFGVPRPKAGDNMLRALESQPLHRAAVRAIWARALGGEEFVETARFGDDESSARHYEMRFRSLRDESGRVVGAYQFVHDVTARLREQARLRDAEAALMQIQKMEAVGQLTGGIAHDFNNLLSAIVGNFELIKARADDVAWVRRFAQSGLQVAERGAKLTGQLLAFSRSQQLELKALDVAQVVGGMRDMLARTLGPMIRLHFDIEERHLGVMSDATQLEMAVLNLAINARDAMAGGGVLTIGSSLQRLEGVSGLPIGDYVELRVVDTGSGMSPEVLAHAFDPFFTTKGVGAGTGLGLSQVYAIARQAGGTALIDSRLGHGTTVRLLLPHCALPAEAQQAVGVPLQPPDTVTRARVLIVDDDADIREVLKALLDALGYDVCEAEDGPRGLALLEQRPPDLLMLDFAMPGMNGAEVARAARARHPDLPIVFASGYADTAALEGVPGPHSPLLRKPFAVAELQRVISEVLKSA